MADRSISLQIIADAKDFQREIAKLPGYTEKSASAAALRMSKEMHKGFKKVEKEAKTSSKKSGMGMKKAMVAGIAGVAAGITSQVVPALTALPGQIVDSLQKAADVQNEISDLSAETGLAVDQLALLRFGAAAAGKDVSALEGAIRPLSKKLGDFALGTGEAKIGLERLGFTAEDFTGPNGSLINTGDAFDMIKERLMDVESETDRADIAMRVFGEGAGQLINVLSLVGDESSALARFQETLGLNTDDARQAATEYQVTMAALSETFKLVGHSLLVELQPAFEFVAIAAVQVIEPIRIMIDSMMDLFVLSTKLNSGNPFQSIAAAKGIFQLGRKALDDYNDSSEVTQERVQAISDLFDQLRSSVVTETTAVKKNTDALDTNTESVQKNKKAREQQNMTYVEAGEVIDDIMREIENVNTNPMKELTLEYVDQKRRLREIQVLLADDQDMQEAILFTSERIKKSYTDRKDALQKELDAADKREKLEKALGVAADSFGLAAEAADTFGSFATMAYDKATEAVDKHNEKISELDSEYDSLQESLTALNEAEKDALANLSEKGRLTDAAKQKVRSSYEMERRALREQMHLNRALKIEERERKLEAVELARRNFKMNKKAQIASAFMNAGQAGINAAATFAPPNPLFFISLGLIAAQLAASVAQIRSQSMPSFHTGGMLNSDEGMFVGRRGESVLSERATQMLGQQTIQTMNEGRSLQPIVVNVNVGRRRLEQVVLDAMQSNTSSVGTMNPYTGR